MAAQVMFRGPMPPAGQVWCVVCQMTAKAAAINSEKGQEAIRLAKELEDGEVWVMVPSDDPKLYPAVVRAMYLPLVQGQIMPPPHDLCWSHSMGVNFRESAILPADAAQMPASGVPLLGQGRR